MNLIIFVIFSTAITTSTCTQHSVTTPLDPKRFIVSGPGITNKFSLSVQYFYIQPVDRNGIK